MVAGMHAANIAANRNQVFADVIEQMMAAQTESVNLFRREGNQSLETFVVLRVFFIEPCSQRERSGN